MEKTLQNSKERFRDILKWIPIIKRIIKLGGKWEQLKGICEPLGLMDTSFRDYPNVNDGLLDKEYWEKRLGHEVIDIPMFDIRKQKIKNENARIDKHVTEMTRERAENESSKICSNCGGSGSYHNLNCGLK